MGKFTLVACLLLFVLVAQVFASGVCPPSTQMPSCKPKCIDNYECTNGKLCCTNTCNAKSCVEPISGSSGGYGSNKDKYNTGSGTYCNNVKCSPFEVCKLDKSTNRMKCQRS